MLRISIDFVFVWRKYGTNKYNQTKDNYVHLLPQDTFFIERLRKVYGPALKRTRVFSQLSLNYYVSRIRAPFYQVSSAFAFLPPLV